MFYALLIGIYEQPDVVLDLAFSLNILMMLLQRGIINSPAIRDQRCVGAARKVFPHWSKKTITHHCLSYFPLFHGQGIKPIGF